MSKTQKVSPKIEDKQIQIKPWMYGVAAAVILIIAFAFYYPSLIGKSLPGHDAQQGAAAGYQLYEYHKNTGEYANWAPNMFSGMPSFQIHKSYQNISSWISDTLYYATGAYIFIAILISISSALLFYAMGVHPIIVIIGGISLLLSNFTIISLTAGHDNKVMVISIVPMTLAGIWLLFEKRKYLIALLIIAFSISLQVRLLHVQITYLMAFLVACWSLYNIIVWIKNKEFKHLILSFVILFGSILLGALNNSTQLLSTKQYSEETQRGGPSEVEVAKNPGQKESDGLSYDYATAWSYGILESLTTLIPNFSGGPDPSRTVDENNNVVKSLTQNNVPIQNAMQVASQLPTYWGSQPFVAGTTYIGAILLYLMFLGIFILPDKRKWWLLASFVLTFFVAWGDNFSTFYHLLFDHLPYFNKFRTPAMVFYLTTIIVAITAALTLQYIINNSSKREQIWNQFFKFSLGFLGLMLFLALAGPHLFSFSSGASDEQLKGQLLQMTQNNNAFAQSIMEGLIMDRKSLMQTDTFRSLIFIALAAGAIALYIKRVIGNEVLLGLIALFILIDVIGVDKRYLNYDSFQENETLGFDGIIATNADKFILEDTSNYRVLDLSVNSFNEAKPTFFHKSIGGYHSVKLKRYQDLISFQINDNLQQFQQGNPSGAQVLNMLNTKYLITSPEASGVYKNEYAYGSAWLVGEVKVLNGPVAVFDSLMSEDLSKTALLERPSETISSDQAFSIDSAAYIKLIKSSNDEMTYSYSSSNPSYAVFSEIYYNNGKGWSAYIDGVHTDHDQVDYILRGLNLPAGRHEISFKFDSPALKTTAKIDLASSFLMILIALGAIIIFIKDNRKQKV